MSIEITELLETLAKSEYGKSISNLSVSQLHTASAKAVMSIIGEDWEKSRKKHREARCACYFSAEFLIGRMIYNNLLSAGLTDMLDSALKNLGRSISEFEEIEDSALGNGGLGRLAACFLDSGAALGLPLDGYGIRYKYGLFKQTIENGFQKELVDDWSALGDPWSVRRDDETVALEIGTEKINAVPYDMPVIGYKNGYIGTLRLWQAEAPVPFDFEEFNNQNYDDSLKEKNTAENISRVLYPNDSKQEGKYLRLSQQYFFCAASLYDRIRCFKKVHGNDLTRFADYVTIQLNDTHPVISIPELIRILTEEEGLTFDDAFETAKKVFNYTNHTVMPEALEKWDISLIIKIKPALAGIIREINERLLSEIKQHKINRCSAEKMKIINGTTVNMAYLACYVSSYINGVAEIHTEILKNSVLREWYTFYPDKFQNKTNGITPRRWLKLCNPGLSEMITELLGDEKWVTDLDELKNLLPYSDDEKVLERFINIKNDNKKKLAEYIYRRDGIQLNPDWIFDIQIKRLHEYKRQLLNILSIIELYFEIKEGSLADFYPTVFIFGAKAAPGYARAKGIIKLINETADLIARDEKVSQYIKVVFVSNYNVSYAEKLAAAADVSEQISTAGTEASGTGNMKLSLNGAVTLGTYDGATIEIVKEAGTENNYIFGADIDEIEKIRETYNPLNIYKNNKKVKRVLDFIISDKISDGGSGIFKELYDSLLKGASWHSADMYYLLYDFESYLSTKIRLNKDYKSRTEFAKKGFINTACCGRFSSDRTVSEYAADIWKIN